MGRMIQLQKMLTTGEPRIIVLQLAQNHAQQSNYFAVTRKWTLTTDHPKS